MNLKRNLTKLFLTLSVGMMSFYSLSQQQITNGGMEEWETVSGSNQEPVNWNSFMTAGGSFSSFAGNQIEESSDVRPGSTGVKSARIWTRSVLGQRANGNLTLGKINMGSSTPTSSSNYNYTDTGNSDFNQPLTDYPDSIVFWAKFNPVGNTNARMKATIHDDFNYRDPEDAASSDHSVAIAEINYPSTNGEWQRFSVPFDYVGPSTESNYILVTFTTCETAGGGAANDEVFIDDVELIYNASSDEFTVEISPSATQNILIEELGIELTAEELPQASSSRQWKYGTVSGGPYTEIIDGETDLTYTPFFEQEGTYYVVCESDFDGEIVVSNEVKINVSEDDIIEEFVVLVTPSDEQTLEEDEAGNELTVTETPEADSREWKYSTISGSGYVSFDSPETGLTYTPLFETAGTYYVVCESILDEETVISNEVKIIVTEPSALDHNDLLNVNVFAWEKELYVDLTNSDLTNTVVNVFNIEGKSISQTKLVQNQVNVIDLSVEQGIYFYQITNGIQSMNGKIFIR